MTPDECRQSIEATYQKITARVRAGQVNASAVEGLMEPYARDAARHNGQPALWWGYMPKEIRAQP